MKRIFFMTLFVILTTIAYGQADDKGYEESKWVLKDVIGLNLSQTAMPNWSADGESSVAGNVYLNGTLTHKTGDWLWVTSLALDYGLSETKSQRMRKSIDGIALSIQLGYPTNNVWYYTLMGNLNTQFAGGYDYPDKAHCMSNFFVPAYSNISVGMEYRPKGNYSAYLSPASTKMTFMEDDYLSKLGAFGVDPEDRFRVEWGTYLKARAELAMMENVNLITITDFSTPYSDQLKSIGINWGVLISMKTNKFLSATLSTTLKYDDDMKTFKDSGEKRGAKVQFKEILGVGVTYNF